MLLRRINLIKLLKLALHCDSFQLRLSSFSIKKINRSVPKGMPAAARLSTFLLECRQPVMLHINKSNVVSRSIGLHSHLASLIWLYCYYAQKYTVFLLKIYNIARICLWYCGGRKTSCLLETDTPRTTSYCFIKRIHAGRNSATQDSTIGTASFSSTPWRIILRLPVRSNTFP